VLRHLKNGARRSFTTDSAASSTTSPLKALASGRVRHAVLDVFRTSRCRPRIPTGRTRTSPFTRTPPTADYPGQRRAADRPRKSARALRPEARSINVVDRDAGYRNVMVPPPPSTRHGRACPGHTRRAAARCRVWCTAAAHRSVRCTAFPTWMPAQPGIMRALFVVVTG